MNYKVIDNPYLFIDNNNKSILNTYDDSLMSYKNKRNNDKKIRVFVKELSFYNFYICVTRWRKPLIF